MAATLIGFSGIFAARAQTDDEVSALLAEALLLPDWDTVLTGSTGVGFKDNVFLSHASPQDGPFVIASAEVLALRVAPTGAGFNFFANGEARYFFGDGLSHQEYTAFARAETATDFNSVFSGTLAAQYFYQDQVLDVSVSETNREAVLVLGHTLMLQPGLRTQLPGHNWIELETHGTRQFFQEPLDDYWDAGMRAAVAHGYNPDSHVMLSYEPSWRTYDNDAALTSSGQAITNSHRLAFKQDTRVTWRQHWDEAKQWRTVITSGLRWNTENGGGFSDYAGWFAAGRIRYRIGPWEISAESRFAHYDYSHQTVSATDPAKRRRGDWDAGLEVERRFMEKAACVLRYDYEKATSNDPLETYSVNTVSMSLRWDF